MKKIYLYSFFVGLGGGLFLIFGPALYFIFGPLGKIPAVVINGSRIIGSMFVFKQQDAQVIAGGLMYALLALPLIFVFYLTPFFRNKFRLVKNKALSLFLSLLLFLGGSFLAYSLFLILAIHAISQWRGPSL